MEIQSLANCLYITSWWLLGRVRKAAVLTRDTTLNLFRDLTSKEDSRVQITFVKYDFKICIEFGILNSELQ